MSELSALCTELGIKSTSEYGAVEVPQGWAPGTHPYKVTLRLGRRQLTVPFFCGPGCTEDPIAADVLFCLVSDAQAGDQSFEDFASDFGYDVDSRKAEATWRTCQSIAPRLRRFLGKHFDVVVRAEH